MAKAMPNASDVAKKWQNNFAGSAQAWQNGINAVDTAPGVLAAAAADRYAANVQAAVPKFQRNVAAVTASEWKQACATKGPARFASGAQAGATKYQAKIGPVLTAIGQIRDSLPPRGDINANINRMVTMATTLHQRAQQGF